MWIERLPVPMRDGVRLRADVLVSTAGERRPALLVRTPYACADAHATLDTLRLAREGWGVVVQNVRGRYDSGGTFAPFVQERSDGFDTVAWCRRQPWCDGRVAMSGASYAGLTQWQAGLGRPLGLEALAPQITASEVRDGWFYEGGILRHAFVQSWGLSLAYGNVESEEHLRRTRTLADDLPGLYAHAPEGSPLRQLLPCYRDWLAAPGDPYWERASGREAGRLPSLPAHHVVGWYDIFCEGGLEDYVAASREGDRQRLLVGPWTHNALFAPQAGEADHGLAANGAASDELGKLHAWLWGVLAGEEVASGARVFVLGAGTWVELPGWPPPAAPLRLYLAPAGEAESARGGALAPAPPLQPGRRRLRHDPARPVPTWGGRTLDPTLPPAGPRDQRRLCEREDVLLFRSPPLDEELRIMGTVRVQLALSSTAAPAHIAVKLLEIDAAGRMWQRLAASKSLRPPAGGRVEAELILGSLALAVPGGHRLALAIAASDFPRLALAASPGEHTIHWGGPHGSFLELPSVTNH